MSQPSRVDLETGFLAGQKYALGIPRNAALGQTGSSLSQRAGSSLEFRDHRAYEPGDDLRHIDWQAFARTDQLTIKLYREEITPHLDLVFDGSKSMMLPGTAKGAATSALIAFFSAAGNRAGYSQTAWKLTDQCRRVPGGHRNPLEWEPLDFDHSGGPAGPLPLFKPRGTRVLISDLLWPLQPLGFMRGLAERSALTLVIQVLAKSDAEPPVGKALRLIDSETGAVKEIQVDAIAARRYRDALSRHQEAWNDTCKQTGSKLLIVIAEDLLRDWNLDPLVVEGILQSRAGAAQGFSA